MTTKITLSAKGWRWWRTGHPWIYRDDLLPRQAAEPGEVVSVVDEQGNFLGQAFYSSSSRLALRFLTRSEELINRAFVGVRVHLALDYRRRVVRDSNASRLIYAEATGFPGLIVDSYDGHLVLQAHHAGIANILSLLLDILQQYFTS